jgi:putative ABC transport system substrate-binding protein
MVVIVDGSGRYDVAFRTCGGKLRRRDFIAGLAAAAAVAPFGARAQHAPLVGFINAGSAASAKDQYDSFHKGMTALGYLDGRNVRYASRFAEGQLDRLPELAEELVRLSPAVIVSAPLPANIAVKKATGTIPIVMASGADPVRFGLVESLARPGGNVTGLTNFAEELAPKQLDLMQALLPRLSRVGLLVNITNPLHVPQLRETQSAATRASLVLVPFEYRVPDDLERAFDAFARAKAEALLVPPDTTFATHRARIAALAASASLPAISFNRAWAERGGLIAYGPDTNANYHRAAFFVDKILKGAKPGDLPVERPTKIQLIINMKVAKALGIEVPATLLARADDIIE